MQWIPYQLQCVPILQSSVSKIAKINTKWPTQISMFRKSSGVTTADNYCQINAHDVVTSN